MGILDLMGHVNQGFADGRQRGQQTRLGQLAGESYTAAPEQRSGILSQMAQIDPNAAQTQQSQFRTQDADGVTRLSQKAKLFVGLAKSGNQQAIATMYPQLAKEASAAFGLQIPETYDPAMLGSIEQLANIGAQQQDNTPASIRELQMLESNPKLYEMDIARRQAGWQPKTLNTADGMAVFDPRTRSAEALNYGGQPVPSQTSQPNRGPGALDINADIQEFAALGIPVTSTRRSQAKNDSVGGVANSFHLSGEAVDMAPQTPQQKQRARQFWEGKGYQVIDEGDHLHAEPPKRGMTVSQVGGGRVQAPAKTTAPSELERRMEMARSMGATPEQLQALVMGSASTKGPSAAEQKDALARKAKQPQVANAVRGIDRIERALAGISGGMVNTGPLDQYATRYTKAGQELEAAVGGIQNSLLSLTRVPGIGSQSDLEARIASMQYPSLDKDPAVNARTLENLKAFIADLQDAYRMADVPTQDAKPSNAITPSPMAGWSIQKVE